MLKIDSHQHFWNYDPVRDNWITEEMTNLQRDFLPSDLRPVLQQNGINACVAVQSDQSEEQNDFLLNLANKNDFIMGVVGWVDFQAENIEERLSYYDNHSKMKGFRHILQGEPERDFMLRTAFLDGIGLLNKYNFTYDILIYPDQLKYTEQFVKNFPDQRFVIDHIAKPDIKNHNISSWKKDILALAKHNNVFCKVSGMITEANWNSWQQENFIPFLEVVFEAFGIDRIMFGSDWPVCNVAGGYNRALRIIEEYTSVLTIAEQELIMGGNAIKFYNLNK